MFESFWKTIYYFFSWFKSPKYMSVNDNDEIEYGKLPDDIINVNTNTNNKLSIKIPQYEFIMLKD